MKKPWFDTIGIDQYGRHYDSLGKYPRKELLKRLGRKHSERMFCDTTDGGYRQTGWIIAGLWISVYKVSAYFKKEGDGNDF